MAARAFCASCEEPITHGGVTHAGEYFCCIGCLSSGPCVCTGRTAPPDFDWQDEPPVTPRFEAATVPPLYAERGQEALAPADANPVLTGPAVLRVSGLRSQPELLELARGLENDPRISGLSLVRAQLDDCWFSVDVDTIEALEQALIDLIDFEVRTRTHPAGIDVTVRGIDIAPAVADTDVMLQRPRLWQLPRTRSEQQPETIEPAAAPTPLHHPQSAIAEDEYVASNLATSNLAASTLATSNVADPASSLWVEAADASPMPRTPIEIAPVLTPVEPPVAEAVTVEAPAAPVTPQSAAPVASVPAGAVPAEAAPVEAMPVEAVSVEAVLAETAPVEAVQAETAPVEAAQTRVGASHLPPPLTNTPPRTVAEPVLTAPVPPTAPPMPGAPHAEAIPTAPRHDSAPAAAIPTEIPTTQIPTTEIPATEGRTWQPLAEQAAAVAPAPSLPESSLPESSAPATSAPATNEPKLVEPTSSAPPLAAVPVVEVPVVEVPAVEMPVFEMGGDDAPARTAPPVEVTSSRAQEVLAEATSGDLIVAGDARPGGAAPLREHITLVVYPFDSFTTLNEFQESARKLHGVTSVKVRRFYKGTLHLAIEYEDIIPFANRLRELEGFAWDHVADRDSEVEIMLIDSPDMSSTG